MDRMGHGSDGSTTDGSTMDGSDTVMLAAPGLQETEQHNGVRGAACARSVTVVDASPLSRWVGSGRASVSLSASVVLAFAVTIFIV